MSTNNNSPKPCDYCGEHIATGYVSAYKAHVCPCCYADHHGPTPEDLEPCQPLPADVVASRLSRLVSLACDAQDAFDAHELELATCPPIPSAIAWDAICKATGDPLAMPASIEDDLLEYPNGSTVSVSFVASLPSGDVEDRQSFLLSWSSPSLAYAVATRSEKPLHVSL